MGIVTSREGSPIDGEEVVVVEILVMMTLGFDLLSPPFMNFRLGLP